MLVRAPGLVVPAEVAAQVRELRVDLVVGLVPALRLRHLRPSPRSRARFSAIPGSRSSSMRGMPSSTAKCGRRSRCSAGRRPPREPAAADRAAHDVECVDHACQYPHQRLTPLGYAAVGYRSVRPMSAAAAAVALPRQRLRDLGAPALTPRAPAGRPSDAASAGASSATPTFGGVGIFLGLAAGIGAAIAAGGVDAHKELLGILGGAALLFVAGLIDDVCSLPAVVKLAAQFGAAAIVLVDGPLGRDRRQRRARGARSASSGSSG